MRLDDGLLIKDNHVGVAGGVAEAVRAAKAYDSGLPIQVEVDRIEQIEPALAAGADRLLLDNMKPDMLREAVALVAGRVPLEASGGVNLDTIRAIAETGVDYISVGRITQSAPAVDIGLDYVLNGVTSFFPRQSGHLRLIGAANDHRRGRLFKGLKPILYGGREVWPLVEGGKGVSATNHASSGAWAAAGGIGTVIGGQCRQL